MAHSAPVLGYNYVGPCDVFARLSPSNSTYYINIEHIVLIRICKAIIEYKAKYLIVSFIGSMLTNAYTMLIILSWVHCLPNETCYLASHRGGIESKYGFSCGVDLVVDGGI